MPQPGFSTLLHVPQYHTNYKIKCYLKHYPTFSKLITYDYPITKKVPGYELTNKHTASSPYLPDKETTLLESIRRTKTVLSDLVLCNSFEYFVTFTFAPHKADRYNIIDLKTKMSTWLKHQRDRYGRFDYLIVAERHKDGAIHFHAMLKGLNSKITPACKLTPKGKNYCNLPHNHRIIKTKKGHQLYNLNSYTLGHSTVAKIDNNDKVGSYIKKYITKDMITFPGQKRYWCSNNLTRPTIQDNPSLDPYTLREFSTVYTGKGYTISTRPGTIPTLIKEESPQWQTIAQSLLT